ncbi:MAG TPA: DUF2116 family Zn-ribbon domain-containing protein [Polyangiaceae bacterium]|nr:DUF2116 family Zn-ribbon domain-containing protein [Polyangiaceae bacterium]
MADVQVACDTCGASLEPNAAYCDKCGARTRRAKRMVRLAIRIELVFFVMVLVLVAAFVGIYEVQR